MANSWYRMLRAGIGCKTESIFTIIKCIFHVEANPRCFWKPQTPAIKIRYALNVRNLLQKFFFYFKALTNYYSAFENWPAFQCLLLLLLYSVNTVHYVQLAVTKKSKNLLLLLLRCWIKVYLRLSVFLFKNCEIQGAWGTKMKVSSYMQDINLLLFWSRI